MAPNTPSLDILYEDGDLLVVNKPADLLSVPGREQNDSVLWRAQQCYPQVLVVHRLDCATSGVMVLAKTKHAQSELSRQFRERETHKQYHAITFGPWSAKHGEMSFPLITDWPNRPKQKICYETGKPSLTRFTLLEQNGSMNRLLLEPVTGRSHQLRLHTLAMGTPIVGDRFYANETIAQMSPRLLLHAYSLSLSHPQNTHTLQFVAPLPF